MGVGCALKGRRQRFHWETPKIWQPQNQGTEYRHWETDYWKKQVGNLIARRSHRNPNLSNWTWENRLRIQRVRRREEETFLAMGRSSLKNRW